MKLTTKEVLEFLSNYYQKKIENISPINQGEWSQAFYFDINNLHKVIRFSNLDEDFKKDQFANGFASDDLPIPKIEFIGQAFDGYFAISPKIDGMMIDHLDSTDFNKTLPSLLKLFDALRKADVSKTTGYGGWDQAGIGSKKSWKEFLTDVIKDDPSGRIDWREKLIERAEIYKVFNHVYQEMTKLVEYCPEDRYLIHNDLLHFNLLIKDNIVAGVIDWGCSLYGDFLYDLAMYDLWQFYYPSMKGVDFKEETKKYYSSIGVALPNFEERLKCYEFHLTLDAMKYSAYKDNDKNLNLIANRVKELI